MNTWWVCLWIGFAAIVGGTVVHHRQRCKPVPSFVVRGLVQIGLGLVLCWSAAHILNGFSAKVHQEVASAQRFASESQLQAQRSRPASPGLLAHWAAPPPIAVSNRAVPIATLKAGDPAPVLAAASSFRSTPTSRLYQSLKVLEDHLGSGSKLSYAPSMQVSHPQMPGRTKAVGTIWVWNEPDYTLQCTIGQDGVCYAASYSRSMGFTADQAVTIIRAELGDHRPVPVPGRANEAHTLHGIILRASDDQRRITFEAPELAMLRQAALEELEAERTKRIHVR